jgi:LPS sulfotransferase NodH
MEWTEQFDPALDFPLSRDVSIRYVICSTPRSGSHFLGQLLYATGRMGSPLEYFNRRNIVRWEERAGTAGAGADLVRFIAGIRTSPNGCFGIKAHYPHLRMLTRHIPIAEFVSAFAHIHIVRRDLLAQAISFARAEQTGDWISRGPASGCSAVYDSDLIRHCLAEIGRQNASWNYLFHAFGIRPLVVEYESLVADPPECVRRVAGFIGVDLPADTPIACRTSRQRDDESESWRDRFIDEIRREALSWADLDVLQHVPGVAGQMTVPRWKRWVKTALRVSCPSDPKRFPSPSQSGS